MERNDHHPISPKPESVKIPLFRSIRFKVVFCVLLLLLSSAAMMGSFLRIARAASEQMERLVLFQGESYQGLRSADTLVHRLSDYLNEPSDAGAAAYRSAFDYFESFLLRLDGQKTGVYSADMGIIGRRFLDTCQQTDRLRREGKTEQMLASFAETEHIARLISAFSGYVIREIEQSTAAQMEDISGSMQDNMRLAASLLGVLMLAVLAVVIQTLNSFLKPLYRLTGCVRQVSALSDGTELDGLHCRDEMGILISAFQEMARRLRQQVQDIQKKQQVEMELLREKEKSLKAEAMLARSELRVYQSQINSHFLFNSLNTVSRLAYIEKAPRVQEAIQVIAQFLREILTQFDRVATLQEEFDIADNYLKIQKLRFGEQIQVESMLDVEVEWFRVPALTIQPLLENAFHHGMHSHRSGFIRYAAERDGGDVCLSVWDDGQGIEPDRQQEILQYILTGVCARPEENCIGLRNIYRRLLYLYPGQVTPILESEPGHFTKIGFRISGQNLDAGQ